MDAATKKRLEDRVYRWRKSARALRELVESGRVGRQRRKNLCKVRALQLERCADEVEEELL